MRIGALTTGWALLLATAAFAAEEPAFMESKAQILGHPIHPMLVVFPLGLFITSLVFDIIGVARNDGFWHKAAYVMIWAGLIGGLAAAIPGFVDYFTAIPGQAEVREDATIHWILNVSAMLIFAVGLVVRRRASSDRTRAPGAALVLSTAAVLVLLTSGWIGGEMVYRDHVGVSAEAEYEEE
jgi:uncharacterized membrane protein